MRTFISSIIVCALLGLAGFQAQASALSETLQTASNLDLANHPTWRKLLHYEGNAKTSVVLTDDFFLSPDGKRNSAAELTATIEAYFSPWGKDTNAHARCRFPARYFWLSKQLALPDYNLREEKCQSLENWALFNSVKSVSLLLVSGYFGNPASTFGHSLLKLNTDSADDRSGLFDLTLSYGALVPENENAFRYVLRGLFGGYQAGFSDKYFYTQDLVYSRTEFRDIWEYRLALTDDERRLLILHIWEIVGRKFTYYFLEKNCAFRLAELLELVVEGDLLRDNGRFWYIPVEVFHQLKDADKLRQDTRGVRLIESVRFIPSSQRVLFHQLKRLPPEALETFNAIVRDGVVSIPAHLEKLTLDQQILVLDSLLAYQQYRLIAAEPDPPRDIREAKDQILLARLQLPPRAAAPVEIPELPSPAEGSRPMEFGASVVTEKNKEPFLRLNWSPFKQELTGQNSLEGDEIVVLDFAIGVFEDQDGAFLDRFDLIRVLNLNTLSTPVEEESPLSWRVRVGVDRADHKEDDRYDGVVSFGVGRAAKWRGTVTTYGLVDVAGHTLDPYVRLRPHAGLVFDWGATRAWLYAGVESTDYNLEFSEVWGGKIQRKLTDRSAVYVEVSNEDTKRAAVGMNWYW